MKVAQQTFKFLAFLSIVLFSNISFSETPATKDDKGGEINTDQEVKDYILHHIQDSHDFSLFSYTNDAGERKHVGFPLPVILWTSKGLTTFMSSEFHHNDDGHVIVEKNGLKFAKIHSKIYELDSAASTVSFDDTHHAINASKVLDFSITKSVFGVLLVGILMLIWFSGLARQYKKKQIPTGFARILEPLVIYVRDEIAKPNIGEKQYRRFTGYLLTVFFFIWILNLLGLTIIELAGAFLIKPFSLLVRLFANISAGHIVVMSLIGIMVVMKKSMGAFGATSLSFVLSLFITLIEVLVAFLQAYIFTMLSALFIGMAVEDHDHH